MLAEALEIGDWNAIELIQSNLMHNDQTIMACDIEATDWVAELFH